MSKYHDQIGIYDEQGVAPFSDPFRDRDEWLLGNERPKDVLAQRLVDAQARLQLANERIYFLTAELAKANAKLGITNYQTEAK